MRPCLCLFALLLSFGTSATGADWLQFRGPAGLGRSIEKNIRAEWSLSDVAWKTKLPGPGTSSPIVLGERIYLTSYTGYALDAESPGQQRDLLRHILCLSRKTGEILWSTVVEPTFPESDYRPGTNSLHGYSSSTPVTDGQYLFVFFGKSGVLCCDLDGKKIWQTSVGTGKHGWGSATSPLLYKDLVIVNASVESKSLVALSKSTGDVVWKSEGMRASWNTPALVRLENGDQELVVSVQKWILGFDPGTGEQLWRCEGVPTYACPSAVSNEGVVYVTGGRGTQYTTAVRAGGRGDVTETHRLWRVDKGSNVSSPVYHDQHLYVINDGTGIAFCFEATTGKRVFAERIRPRPSRIYASPTFADGKIFIRSQHTGAYVLAARPEYDLLAHNTLGDDDSRANASPVIHHGQILLRNDRYLYCIGERVGN